MRTLSFILFIWILIIFYECMFWEIPQEYISHEIGELTSKYLMQKENLDELKLVSMVQFKLNN